MENRKQENVQVPAPMKAPSSYRNCVDEPARDKRNEL